MGAALRLIWQNASGDRGGRETKLQLKVVTTYVCIMCCFVLV